MMEQLSIFFDIEMIYLWLNIGIIPFWFILMFFPQSRVCGLFVTSIFPKGTLNFPKRAANTPDKKRTPNTTKG